MANASDFTGAIASLGLPGGLCCLGILAGTTSDGWPEDKAENIAEGAYWAFFGGLVWIGLIFLGRLTGWHFLRRLDLSNSDE